MSAVCPACDRPQTQGLLCHGCTSTLEYELGDVPAVVAELEITLSRQSRVGSGGKGGLASEKTPIHSGAMLAADYLQNTLTTWARDVSGETFVPGVGVPPSHAAAMFLLMSVNDIRKHPAVAELVDEVCESVRQARRCVDRPADRQFVGPCGAEVEGVTCTEDLYARPGAAWVRCRVCSTEHDVADRRAWLLDQAKDRLFTVREAAQMMGDVGGIRVTEASIRGYLHRGRIGYRLGTMIRLGDLLEVVLDDSERRSA